MSYNELSRRELQRMCKEYGLPANKTNAAMASSLRTFLGDPRTNVLARAPLVVTSAVVKKTTRAKVMASAEMQGTSLAALILAAKPRELVSNGKPLKRSLKLPERSNIKADLSAFIVPAPEKIGVACFDIPKSAPLLRRSKQLDVVPPSITEGPTGISSPNQQDSPEAECIPESLDEGGRHNSFDNYKLVASPSAQDQKSSDTYKLVASPSAQDQKSFDTYKLVASPSAQDQGNKSKPCCEKYVKPALSPLFRITANVDKLINRATAMLEKFQEWKGDLPQEPSTDIVVGTS